MADASMRAAILTAFGEPLEIRDVARPAAGPGQVLVRLEACGVCHSDVHLWKGEVTSPEPPSPFIIGHEGIGRVVEVGEGVSGWAVGDYAGVPWIHDTCMHCDECLDGHESFCQHQRAHGLNVPGGFAEFVVADASFAVRLPDSVDPVTTAPVMCAGVTAYGALRRAQVSPGECVAVFGCGGLGLYAVQLAKRLGASVLAVDRDPAKLAHARSYGADWTEVADGDLVARLAARAVKPHAVINFAPTTATWDAMLAAVRPLGRIVSAALVSQPVALNQEWLTFTGVTITGTSVGTRREMEEVVAIHSEAPLHNPITEIGLGAVSEALQSLEEGRAAGRYVIRF